MRLTAEQLSCERGGRMVFTGVDFSLATGELLILTGPNGSGKTSLLRLIAGFLAPAAGKIRLEGGHGELSIGQQSHYVSNLDALKSALTAAENLHFWCAMLGGGGAGRALESFDLVPLANYPAALLSAGQKRRLGLARLALAKRVLWLLDEPAAGLDKNSRLQFCRLMQAQLDSGGLIIAATQVPLGLLAQHELDLGQSW